jgi:NADPH:quinone reductase-like Zn-dependent oxidoreductase
MKAIVYEQFGPPEVLRLKEVTKPTPQDNEVLIKVAATTVNAGDSRMRSLNVPPSYWLLARMVLGFRKPKKPILGMELAGEIEAVGKDVTRFKPGDQVVGSTFEYGLGAHAEYRCLRADAVLAIKSTKLSFAEATTLPVGGRTALYFLREANIQPGQSVLIYGASGSVGTFAVQLAKYFGASVIGVCSTVNLELVRSLGADQVIDYTKENFAKSGQTYDVIFDVVGLAAYADCMKSLKPKGTYLQAVSAPGISLRMRWTALTSNKRLVGGGPPPKVDDLVFLQELVATGQLKVVIDQSYPLEQIAEAHRYVDTGRKRGNVVIMLGQNHDLKRQRLSNDQPVAVKS